MIISFKKGGYTKQFSVHSIYEILLYESWRHSKLDVEKFLITWFYSLSEVSFVHCFLLPLISVSIVTSAVFSENTCSGRVPLTCFQLLEEYESRSYFRLQIPRVFKRLGLWKFRRHISSKIGIYLFSSSHDSCT